MSFHSAALAFAISLTLLGCTSNPYAVQAGAVVQRIFQPQDDDRLWRVQKARQQRIAREAGRIGYIGNAGPALGTSLPSSSFQ
jgi:hypothetical protein